jgi:uncharacterized lipoprotein YddW (UPF0748 family)
MMLRGLALALLLLCQACGQVPLVNQSSGQSAAPASPPQTAQPQPFIAAAVPQSQTIRPPPTPFEFRAAWIATVANIDWPSRKGLPTARLKAEIDAIVARSKSIGLNALILQVRPAADAIYPSAIEPWSEFLTGTQGQPPDDLGFDPLAYWIEQAHLAGLQLHAWFNPYRAWHFEAKGKPAKNHISQTRPDLVKRYDRFEWLDPGEPDAAAHSLQVILDVVKRYDIDGVHMDDYFYPYPDSKQTDFPDSVAWARFLANKSKVDNQITRAQWRRRNVDQFVNQVYVQTKAIKPWVAVGISPFGIGKPALRPTGIKGFSQYDSLYADVELWLAQGWLDYLVPQLYFRQGQQGQDFNTLLTYWESQNPKSVPIWSGLFTSRVRAPNPPDAAALVWPASEIDSQVQAVQERAKDNPLLGGQVHFSFSVLMNNTQSIADLLTQRYATPALVPALRFGAPSKPAPPIVKRFGENEFQLTDDRGQLSHLLIWENTASGWRYTITPTLQCPCSGVLAKDVNAVVVIGVSRNGQESEKVYLP